MDSSDKNVFSEEEVQAIIRNAMELRGEHYSDFSGKHGISKEELLEIGEDVGLSNYEIERAVDQYVNAQYIQRSDITDTHITEEREFKTDLAESVIWEEIVDILTHNFGNKYGSIDEDPKKKVWKHTSFTGIETQLSLTKKGSLAKVRISQHFGIGSPISKGISYGGIIALASSFLHSVITESGFYLFLGLFLALWVILSSVIYRINIKKRKRKQTTLSSLANKIIERLPKELELKTEAKKTNDVTNPDEEMGSLTIEIDNKDQYKTDEKDTGSDASGSESKIME